MLKEIILNIGKRLQQERERLGLLPQEVYQGLDIAQTTYRDFETGKRDIPASILIKLKEEFGFNINQILFGG